MCIALASVSSCRDTLDTHPTEIFDESTVWGSYNTAAAFVNSTYESVLNGIWGGSGTSVAWEARTPNAVKCSQVGEGIDNIATELGITTSSDFGANRFSVLRKCNLIIEKVAASDALSEDEKALLIAEGRFLRGMVFFDQARKMGRFVPLCKVLETTDEEGASVPMTKDVAESYSYVITDLQAAVEGLPATANTGKATKWAAEVLLSRACLQAYAYTQDSKYLDIAISACEDAVNNSGITLSSNYAGLCNESDLYNKEILLGYYRLKSNTKIGQYEELIRTYPNISTDENKNAGSEVYLKNKDGKTFEGWAIYFPSQDLVDQYLVIDDETGEALPWDQTSQWKKNVVENDPSTVTRAGQIDAVTFNNGWVRRIPSDQDLKQTKEGYPTFTKYAVLKADSPKNISQLMYEGRDKRFAASIIYDGCTWVNETVHTNLTGNLSIGVRDKEDGGWYNTVTSYYWRKGNIENPSPRAFYDCYCELHYNIARLGEAYLNLAEAYLCKGNGAAAVEALNNTRTIHGGLPEAEFTTLDKAWEDYIRERRVELCNEGGDIYFSYLRWGKYGGAANAGRPAGDVIEGLEVPAHKIEITKNRNAVLIGQLTLNNSAQRTFTTRRYLMPIAESFLNTRESYNLDHNQNEGW